MPDNIKFPINTDQLPCKWIGLDVSTLYLISTDKKFSNQFSVHFSINR